MGAAQSRPADATGTAYDPWIYPGDFSSLFPLSEKPALAWSGNDFILSWDDGRDIEGDNNNFEIYMTLMTADGTDRMIDYNISNGSGASFEPSIAWTGSEIGAVWQDDRDGDYDIYMMDTKGKGLINLTNNSTDDYYPCFYPE